MPVEASGSNATLQVCLCADNTGTIPLKTFDLKMTEVGGSMTSNFPLLADHFYGIGHKGANASVPDSPTDPDIPVDLSKDQEIVITVETDWSVIFDLDVE